LLACYSFAFATSLFMVLGFVVFSGVLPLCIASACYCEVSGLRGSSEGADGFRSKLNIGVDIFVLD
jgi:hypothetical protein